MTMKHASVCEEGGVDAGKCLVFIHICEILYNPQGWEEEKEDTGIGCPLDKEKLLLNA